MPDCTDPLVTIKLRLLETTDVHGHILPFNYLTRRGDTSAGLARTATLIREARREAANCLLFDTGDFLQGAPLIDMTGHPNSGWTGDHPAITAMNRLGYDAVGLGNHEFNFGIDWLLSTLGKASFPVTCANAVQTAGATPQDDKTLVAQYLVLDRALPDTQGQMHDLRIGVIGLLPPQITHWDHFHLENRLVSRSIAETARALVPEIRAKGADIVIALAHTGIEQKPPHVSEENATLALAEVPGIDAILAGHSHLAFPTPDHAGIEGVDVAQGLICGVPGVMAGARGSHLGVLDLTLQHTGAGWAVASSRAEARPVKPSLSHPPVRADPALCDVLEPAHQATLTLMEKPIGQTRKGLHSYLSMVRSDPVVHLIAQAKRDALHRIVPEQTLSGLPVLSAASAFRTGGRAGPRHFTDIPAGPLSLRHATDIYAFPNTLCALIVTGAQVRDWLERAAAYFNQIVPGRADQPLINPAFPGHHFDVIDGLNYEIDLSAPSRYGPDGTPSKRRGRRISNLRYLGQPIDREQEFIVATNNFRLFGGAPYASSDSVRKIFKSYLPVIDAVKDKLRAPDKDTPASPTWMFRSLPGTSVVFETGPGLRRYPEDIAALGLTDLGDTETGFARFHMDL
jgi:2',3'-cyclic-nucleotide 2'-phosphodiesterase/3'-nucleotidase